jgi:hypothetical protein
VRPSYLILRYTGIASGRLHLHAVLAIRLYTLGCKAHAGPRGPRVSLLPLAICPYNPLTPSCKLIRDLVVKELLSDVTKRAEALFVNPSKLNPYRADAGYTVYNLW